MKVVGIQLREVARRFGVQSCEGRPALRQNAGTGILSDGLRVFPCPLRRRRCDATDPGHGAHVDRRRPVRGVDLPVERRQGNLRKQALDERYCAKPLVVLQVQCAKRSAYALPELVLLLPARATLRADVPRQLLEIMHDRALVSGFVGRTVAPPVLAACEQPTAVLARAGGPRHVPECLDLAMPDPLRAVSRGNGMRDESIPNGTAHPLPGVIQRSDGRPRHERRVSVYKDDEVVRRRTDRRRLTLPATRDPLKERVVIDHRLVDPASGVAGTPHGVRGQERQQVRAAPQVAGAARLRHEALHRADGDVEARRQERTSTASVNGSCRGRWRLPSRRRSRKSCIGRYSFSSGA